MEDDPDSLKFKINETEQEKKLLKNLNEKLANESENIRDENQKLKDELRSTKHKTNELEQEKKFLEHSSKLAEMKQQVLSRKYLLTVAAIAIGVGISFSIYSIYVVDLVGKEYQVNNEQPITTGYVIQNLRGDTIDTWLSWRLVPNAVLYVNILNADRYPQAASVIEDVVLSTESIEIDDSLMKKGPKGNVSTYYLGWKGALDEASKNPTQMHIPTNLQVVKSPSGAGDITIELTNLRNGDGFSGWTKSIADESQNQILKSHIIIYEADKLSTVQLETIVRHEFGHALGLAHSTAPEELMAPSITTNFPYISSCTVDALVHLYDGGKTSEVICEK